MEKELKDAIERVYNKALIDSDLSGSKNAGERIIIGNKIIKVNVNAEDERTIWIRIKDRSVR